MLYIHALSNNMMTMTVNGQVWWQRLEDSYAVVCECEQIPIILAWRDDDAYASCYVRMYIHLYPALISIVSYHLAANEELW